MWRGVFVVSSLFVSVVLLRVVVLYTGAVVKPCVFGAPGRSQQPAFSVLVVVPGWRACAKNEDCHLQVTGLMPSSPFAEQFADAAVEWLGGQHRVAFSFALDLSPWMVRDGPDEADPPSSAGATCACVSDSGR